MLYLVIHFWAAQKFLLKMASNRTIFFRTIEWKWKVLKFLQSIFSFVNTRSEVWKFNEAESCQLISFEIITGTLSSTKVTAVSRNLWKRKLNQNIFDCRQNFIILIMKELYSHLNAKQVFSYWNQRVQTCDNTRLSSLQRSTFLSSVLRLFVSSSVRSFVQFFISFYFAVWIVSCLTSIRSFSKSYSAQTCM